MPRTAGYLPFGRKTSPVRKLSRAVHRRIITLAKWRLRHVDDNNRAQIYMRTRAADGTWSLIQQLSNAKGNASRPTMALRKNQLHVAWTETDGEDSRVVLRTATVGP